ncbi:MAG: hypothetical protein Q7R78_01825 [bacterium]|nr:hypothetical protein [bacterium]
MNEEKAGNIDVKFGTEESFSVPITQRDFTLEEYHLFINPENDAELSRRAKIIEEKNINPGLIPIDVYGNRKIIEFGGNSSRLKEIGLKDLDSLNLPEVQKDSLKNWLSGPEQGL